MERTEIERYLKEKNISYQTDSSNLLVFLQVLLLLSVVLLLYCGFPLPFHLYILV